MIWSKSSRERSTHYYFRTNSFGNNRLYLFGCLRGVKILICFTNGLANDVEKTKLQASLTIMGNCAHQKRPRLKWQKIILRTYLPLQIWATWDQWWMLWIVWSPQQWTPHFFSHILRRRFSKPSSICTRPNHRAWMVCLFSFFKNIGVLLGKMLLMQ